MHVAWSSAETGAAARVIRAIRRSISEPTLAEPSRKDVDSWSLTTTTVDVWRRRPSWLPGAGALGPLLETIETNTATKVGDLFDVHQGIRTGANPVFMQPFSVVRNLPENERRYFRKAIDAASFVEGELKPEKYLFYAPKGTWKTEEELSQAVPQFFNLYIRPSRETLNKRKSMRSKTDRYWELAWSDPVGHSRDTRDWSRNDLDSIPRSPEIVMLLSLLCKLTHGCRKMSWSRASTRIKSANC